MANVVRRLRMAWREQGAAALAFRALAAVVGRASFGRLRLVWYVLVAQPVRTDWRLPARLGRKLVVQRFDTDDPLLHQAPRPDGVLAARFAQQSVCFAAHKDGQLLGFLWLCPRQYLEDDVRALFVLPASGAAWWDYDVWVAPEARNGIVFMKLWQAAHEYLAVRGARWTMSRIVRLNPASLAAHGRAGARGVGHAWFACGRRWQLAVGVRPGLLHFSRGSWAPPRIAPTLPADARAAVTAEDIVQCR